jgi:hypothetical protein
MGCGCPRSDVTPREFARTRLLAQAQGREVHDLLPGVAGHLCVTPETTLDLAFEFEAVAHALLAVIESEGYEPTSALQLAFLALDKRSARRDNAPPRR